jgi:RNA:NAD 2'-phosphotransferase (TPT1/KptA family)
MKNDTAYVGKRYSKNDEPTILKINARQMYDDGFIFKLSDNNVYQVELVPIKYIIKINR